MSKTLVFIFMCSAASVVAHPVQHDMLGMHHGAGALIALMAIVGVVCMARRFFSQSR